MLTNIITNIATVVVVGKWNINIFDPEWVKENIFKGETIEVAISLPSGPFKFKGKTFALVVDWDRIRMELCTDDASSRVDIITALRDLLRLLSQTPVSAFGINVWLKTDEDLSSRFETMKLDAQDEGNLMQQVKQEMKWTISNNDNCDTNIRLFKGDSYTFDFNYNYTVTNVLGITSVIENDDIITGKLKQSKKFLNTYFGISNE